MIAEPRSGDRDEGDRERDPACAVRLEAAARRDMAAAARERDARRRDELARARDDAIARREADIAGVLLARRAGSADHDAAGPGALLAHYLEEAAGHRRLAAADRELAARDRERAAGDRLHALADREVLACEIANDDLTGARTRAVGLFELEQEIDRSAASGTMLTVAFVEVVGLTTVNEHDGRRAGDELLRRVVARISMELRIGDVLLRLGGDEFVCAIVGTTPAQARERFRVIATGLQRSGDSGAIRTGFAQLTPGDRTAELIGRAEQDLSASRLAAQAAQPAPARSNARTAS